ncbi:hypothetical protein GCM10009737_10840 [Nocardioides lentus]|uniref:Uncharacterized protein n=1 Tax=Nocardioides lentus TaxID=338077 RepID=A0ABN2P382_9ACTN
MTTLCTTPAQRTRSKRLAVWWALHTEWLEWPFTTKRELRRRAHAAMELGFQAGVDRSVEAAQKVGKR